MSSAEVCGFVIRHEPKETVADALVIITSYCRSLNVELDGMK